MVTLRVKDNTLEPENHCICNPIDLQPDSSIPPHNFAGRGLIKLINRATCIRSTEPYHGINLPIVL
jgi:hypothetical protein